MLSHLSAAPKTQQQAIHTHSMSPVRRPASFQDALSRVAVGRKCTHVAYDPCLRLAAAHCYAGTGRRGRQLQFAFPCCNGACVA